MHKQLGVYCPAAGYFELGKKGDYEGAIAEYREAIRLDPKSDTSHQFLGEALGAKGDRGGEIAEEREALRLNPGNKKARADLNRALQVELKAEDGADKKEFKQGFFGVLGIIVALIFGGAGGISQGV